VLACPSALSALMFTGAGSGFTSARVTHNLWDSYEKRLRFSNNTPKCILFDETVILKAE
jgi:hypothetical protein